MPEGTDEKKNEKREKKNYYQVPRAVSDKLRVRAWRYRGTPPGLPQRRVVVRAFPPVSQRERGDASMRSWKNSGLREKGRGGRVHSGWVKVKKISEKRDIPVDTIPIPDREADKKEF